MICIREDGDNMNQKIKHLALLFFCVILTACSNKTVGSKDTITIPDNQVTMEQTNTDEALSEENTVYEKSFDEYKDCTGEIRNTVDISEEARFSTVGAMACLGNIYKNVAELYPAVKNIVVGEVVSVAYIDTDANARTYYSFAVTEVLKGNDIEKESIVTILELQGYCRLSQFVEKYGTAHFEDYDAATADSAYFIYTLSGEPMVQPGDKYVLFLGEQCEDENASKYYVVQEAFIGKYQLNSEGYYERYSPEDCYYEVVDEKTKAVTREAPMTLEEMREAVNAASQSN